jgi:hypothetical protein
MTLSIPANDHGRIYVYSVPGVAPPGIVAKEPEALKEVFGADLNPDYVDVVNADELSGLPLASYIRQGYDMPEDGMNAELLNSQRGIVVLLMSRAFGDEAVELNPTSAVEYVTTVAEPSSFTAPEVLRSEGAAGDVGPGKGRKVPSDAALSGRVAMVALVVLFAVVGLMLWVAA